MTSVSVQQMTVAAVHSYCLAQSTPHINASITTPTEINRIENDTSIFILKKYDKFKFDYWKDSIPLANIFFIEVLETLGLTDTVTKKVSLSVAETLSLSDVATKIRKVIVNVNETFSLTDTPQKLVRHFASDALSFVDTTNKLVKKGILESLSLAETEMKHANKLVQDTLSLSDIATTVKKVFREIAETLNLVDSASRVFTPGGEPPPTPPPAIPGGAGRRYIYPTYKPTKESIDTKIKHPYFIYRFNIFESLNLKDSVSSIAYHYIPRLIYQNEIKEYLTFMDKVTVRIIRTGRKKILNQIKSMLQTIDFLDIDIGQAEDNPIAIAAEFDRINLNLTKTNREGKIIHDELEKQLHNKLKIIIREYKKGNGYLPVGKEQEYQDDIKSIIRMAVQQTYILAINYVQKALKSNKVYLSGTDVETIKIESQRIYDIFWKNAQELIRDEIIKENMKNLPIAVGGILSILGISKLIAGIITFGTLGKATQTKIQQLPPPTATIDPSTQTAEIKKRILVFKTKNDSKVCVICERYEGIEYYEDDPFIVRPVEDTHINCRCRLLLKEGDDVISG